MTASGLTAGTVVVLFTDLVDSTARSARVSAQEADEARRQHFACLRAEVEAHRGSEIKTTGDGLMVVFATAAEAVDGAVAMQRAITPVAMRVGVSAGDAVVEDGDWFGDAVVEAARLCAACDAGSIVVADVVRRLAGRRSGHRFESLGELELKGFPDAVVAYRVEWEQPVAAGAAALPPTLDRTGGTFVGRDDEEARLRSIWEQTVVSTARRVAAIAGEPGIGKSRLAAEVAAALHAGGALVLHGRCEETGAAPYEPIAQALDQLFRGFDPQHLRRLLGPSGRELVRLLPDLADRVPGLGRPTVAEPDGERRLLVDAIDTLIERLSLDAPVLLVIDDVHWADQPTLQLVRHLVRSHRAGPLVIVVTYRETELGRTHPLADALADLRRDDHVERVLLRGLTGANVTDIVGAWPGIGEDVETLAASVHAETDGNPFFVQEVLRHLVDVGADAGGVPEGIREVVGRRLSRLSDDANAALRVAAVAGREFDVGVVEAVTGQSADVVLDSFDAALAAGLLIEAGTAGRYGFAHALVRQTLYDELSLTRRVRTHWRVGAAIAARADAGDRSIEIAHHLAIGVAEGDVTMAVDACLAAADIAAARAAVEDVTAFAERAIALLGDAGMDEPDRLARAHLHRGWALRSESMAAAWGAYRDAVDVAQHGEDALLYFRTIYLYGLFLSPETDWLLARLHEAIGRLGDDHPFQTVSLLSMEAMQMAGAHGRAAAAQATADFEAAVSRLEDGPLVQSMVTSVLALQAIGSPDLPAACEGLALVLASVEDEDVQDHDMRMEMATSGPLVKILLPVAALASGDMDAFEATIADFEAEAAERMLSATNDQTGWYRSAVALARGPIADAKAEIWSRREHSVTPSYGPQLAMAYAAEGRTDAAVERIRGFTHVHSVDPDAMDLRAWIANTLVDAGRIDEAAADLDELARNDFQDVRDDFWRPMAVRHLAELCADLAHTRGAAALQPMVEPYAGQMLVAGIGVTIEGAADRARGVVALTLGELDEAVEHLRAAAALEDRCGFAVLSARTRFWWARALLARGEAADRAEAAVVLSDVVAACDALGLVPLGARATALVASALPGEW